MIGTAFIKSRLYNGYFSIGPENGRRILIVGSCRTVPYVNYFKDLIDHGLASYHVTFIDPHDFHWDKDNRLQDLQAALLRVESDPVLLGIFERTDVFIHEYHKNYGCFNSVPGGKTIYQFGLNPSVDIGIPNWHNKALLAHDIVERDQVARMLLGREQYIGELYIKAVGQRNLHEFRMDVLRSGIPWFLDTFDIVFKKQRLFANPSHILTGFTYHAWLEVLERLGIGGTLPGDHFHRIGELRMYEECKTPVCRWDVENFRLEWGEAAVPAPVANDLLYNKMEVASGQVSL